ncbi:MAG: M23 family metallopeptidase [Smithellaceae bacterium]|jgi:lipoprotein NlpD
MERIKNLFITTIVLASLVFFSCSGPQIKEQRSTGVYHPVKKGETLYSIARVYNIDLQELARINGIEDVSVLKEGTVLFIPEAKHVIEDVMTSSRTPENDSTKKTETISPKVAKPAVKQSHPPQNVTEDSPGDKTRIETANKNFIWPVQGTVKTNFGRQPNKTYHNWIKIVAPEGTKVKAAAVGIIIFSSQLKDYGHTVIIRHEKDFTTVYTHLKEKFVKTDQSVKQGDIIAIVGEKDESGAAYINFEIRIKGKASNPLLFLP